MTAASDSTHTASTNLGRIRQPLAIIIVFDLLTMGLYSIGRSYFVHFAIAQKTGRRLFTLGFLHILVLLNLATIMMGYSRNPLPPDLTVFLIHFAAGVLAISLLLVFRRYLAREFGLRLHALPLGLFGFWYMQFHINRYQSSEQMRQPINETFWITSLTILLSLSLSLLPLAVKVHKIASVSIEREMAWGDSVLVDQFSYVFFSNPKRADLLVYRSPHDEKNLAVNRVIGLPGDRIAFRADGIRVNDELIHCQTSLDQLAKKSYTCELDGQKFRLGSSGGFTRAHAGDFEVPLNHYFMLGDHLDNFTDSRTIGPIPLQFVTGRVLSRWSGFRLGAMFPLHRLLK